MTTPDFTPEPMSKAERLKKNLLWCGQGVLAACGAVALAFGLLAAWGALSGAPDAIEYAADLMFSGFVLAILLATTIIPAGLSSLKNEAGVLRALGAVLGLILAMGLISEIASPA